MISISFSPQTLGLMAQILPEYFTHTGLETVFMMSGVIEPAESTGVSKQRRVLNVLHSLRDAEGSSDEVVRALASELLRRVTRDGTVAAESLEPGESSLVMSLNRDGWRFDGRALTHDLSTVSTTAINLPPNVDPDPDRSADRATSRRVFIVHGRDLPAKDSVARFVERIGFVPVVLHEQANLGRTVLDVGSLRGEEALSGRARQNVVLEFGYFVGLLGRDRVCALVAPDVELPSDLSGLLYVAFNPAADDWKMSVAREMREVGLNVDLNSI
jgi:predicted nucleotide-binding protein